MTGRDDRRVADLTARQQHLVEQNAARLMLLQSQQIGVQIPMEARLEMLIEHLLPGGTISRAEFDVFWEERVGTMLAEVEERAATIMAEAEANARRSALLQGVRMEIPPDAVAPPPAGRP